MSKDKQRKHFDKGKHQYHGHLVLNPPRHTERELALVMAPLRQGRLKDGVADFGAGSGRLTIALLRNNIRTTAVDISRRSLQELMALAKRIGKTNYLRTAGRLDKGPYRAIAGTDILHHVDIGKYLPIFSRHLDKDGLIVFSEPNAWNPAWYLFLTVRSSWEVEKGILQCTYFNLQGTLRRAGFGRVRITGFGLLPPPLLNWSPPLAKLNYFLGNCPFLKMFAYRFIIEGRK